MKSNVIEKILKEEESEHRTQVVGRFGHTHGDYSDLFNLFKNKDNWKHPVKKVFSYEDWYGLLEDFGCSNNQLCHIISDCVSYFTGSVPTFSVRNSRSGSLRPGIQITADGYYKAVGP